MIKSPKRVLLGILASSLSVVLLSSTLTSASAASSETTKYIAMAKKLGVTEAKLINRYSNVTGTNYTDDYTLYAAVEKLIPDVNNFINKLEASTPSNTKLRNLHRIWVKGWNKQAEGMMLVLAALDAQDYGVMAKANAALASGRATLSQFSSAFRKL
jgi:hypothetical protein